MSYELEYLDYEDMDDLVLPDHIEFDNDRPEEFSMDALDTVYAY